jgi:hypothetical protein
MSGLYSDVSLSITPWRLAYVPVKKVAREGQQIDVVTNAFSIWAPSWRSLSIFGVSM